MKTSGVTLRRYALPSEGGEGWAIVVIGSDGYFSTVSDYGNYSFIWTHHGCKDFRQFLLRAERDWDYFVGKLSPIPGGMVYDAEATAKEIKRYICERRRELRFTAEEARAEWDRLERYEVDYGESGFVEWCRESDLSEPWEFRQQRHEPQCKAFVQKVIGARLGPILRAELVAEGVLAA